MSFKDALTCMFFRCRVFKIYIQLIFWFKILRTNGMSGLIFLMNTYLVLLCLFTFENGVPLMR